MCLELTASVNTLHNVSTARLILPISCPGGGRDSGSPYLHKDLSIQLMIGGGRGRSIFLCGEAMSKVSVLPSTRPHPCFCSNPN